MLLLSAENFYKERGCIMNIFNWLQRKTQPQTINNDQAKEAYLLDIYICLVKYTNEHQNTSPSRNRILTIPSDWKAPEGFVYPSDDEIINGLIAKGWIIKSNLDTYEVVQPREP